MNTFRTVALIGVGLIGGSVGMALKRRFGSRVHVIGIGRSPERLRDAVLRGAVDRTTTDFADGVSAADVVVICTPVETIVEYAARAAPFLTQHAVVTDVGSVKKPVVDGIRRLRKMYPALSFVAAHPVAGSERSGVNNARADLFEGAYCVICPAGTSADRRAVHRVTSFWRALGARVVHLAATTHDRILAATSHAPHLVSFALSRSIHRGGKPPVLAGGAYRDMTRVAASNPVLWSWICWMNRRYVGPEIDRILRELTMLRRRLGERRALERYLAAARPPSVSDMT